MTKYKTPTIKNLLACIPSNGIETVKDELLTYASLSFYFDGEDMKDAKVNKIKAKQKLIESLNVPNQAEITEMDDEYLLTIEGVGSYRFMVPSLKNMPEIKEGQLSSNVKAAINQLAEDPSGILSLPFCYFKDVVEVVGKSIGL